MMVFSACSRDSSTWAVAEAAWGSEDVHGLSIATRQSRPQAIGARGAPHLPFGFASKPNSSVPWAHGLLSAFWECGYTDLPAYSPRRGSTSGPVRPIFTSKHSRPSRGAKPHEADDTRPPRGRPHQAGSRGAERSRQGTPREVPVTQAMTTGARRAPVRAVSSFPLSAKEASAGVESRGIRQRFPYRCNETETSRTAGRRSPWSPRRRHRQSLWQVKTTFS